MGEKQKIKKEREFIVDCIHLYRELPVLWNVKSKEYHDRDKKNTAYETLLVKYREMFPQATKDELKKKFNSLRTNYRKELKKYLQSMKSGSSADDVYEPSLWYYKEVFFLQNDECAADSQSTMDKSQSMGSEENSRDLDTMDANETQDSTATTNTETPYSNLTLSGKGKKLQKRKKNEDELLELASKRLRQKPDEYENWALSCAADLKKMEPMQQIFAKNAIAAIIMEGQLGYLRRNSVKINEPTSTTSTSISTPTSIQYSSTPSPQYEFSINSQQLSLPPILETQQLPYNQYSEQTINDSQGENVESLGEYLSSFQDQ